MWLHLMFSFSVMHNHLLLIIPQENYTAPRLVLAASGVDHEDLLSYSEPLLSDLPKVPPPETPKSTYVGGDYRCQADSEVNYEFHDELFLFCFLLCECFLFVQKTHVALAFEVPGGWLKDKDAMTLTVLQVFTVT